MAQKTFLLADDATFIRKLLKDMIEENEDYIVVGEARDGREAVEKAAMLQPDIMTIDITMPEMDGLEALPEIVIKSPETKVIVVSALSDQEQVLKALRRGASEFIIKPFDKGRIIDVIHKVLKQGF